ncbi:MAG: helix-turn-helix domain-containing GNAT family N-acetyltransferase [Pseudomonadales bacterium]
MLDLPGKLIKYVINYVFYILTMDVLRELGPLALGSRLKRLSDRLMQDGIRVYRESGLSFEPRWFPVYYYLSHMGPSAVTDVARGLGITHPSVNQVAKEMIAANLVSAYKDPKDKRKRVLALTKVGKSLLPELEVVWRDIASALRELLEETQVDFLGYVETLERALDDRGFHSRFLERYQPAADEIEILAFSGEYQSDFKAINEAWILEYFEMEPADQKMLDDPQAVVIDSGGEILFARDIATGNIVGTAALINHGNGLGELAKMGVRADARGRGIGKLIGRASIARARELGFNCLYLETSSRLAAALGLYRQLGFVRKPSPFESDYSRADVYMEIEPG